MLEDIFQCVWKIRICSLTCGVHSLGLSGTPRDGKLTSHRNSKVGKHLQDCQVQPLIDQHLVNQSQAVPHSVVSCTSPRTVTPPPCQCLTPFREEILADVQPELLLVLPEAINDAVLCSVVLLQVSLCLQAPWLHLHWSDVKTCFLVPKTFLFRTGSKAKCVRILRCHYVNTLPI